MKESLMTQLEEATGIAFKEFRAKHPALAMEVEQAALLDAVIRSINADPEALAALDKATEAQNRLAAIGQLAQLVRQKLPAVLAKFGV